MVTIPLFEVDAERRMVFARLDETPDSSGHIMDYASSKPNFMAWSDSMSKASGGLNLGNVRAMHGGVAAGMVKEIACDDAAKTITFGIAVVNDQEFRNCLMGLYTGISPGGRMRKWADGAYSRFEAKPDELSLVDRPSNPNATFVLRKAAEMEEKVAFARQDDVPALVVAMSKAAGLTDLAGMVAAFPAATVVRVFGNLGERAPDEPMVKRFADPDARRTQAADGHAMPDGAFPIIAVEDIAIAVAGAAHAADPIAARAHIAARAQALGASDAMPTEWRATEAPMKKGLDQVSCIARILQDISWLANDVVNDAAAEGDGSQVPAHISDWLVDGAAIMTAMAGEESVELLALVQTQIAQLAALKAASSPADAVDFADADPMTKGAAWPVALAMTAELAVAREEMRKFAGERTRFETDAAALRGEVARLSAIPRAGGPRLRAVGKAEDGKQTPNPQSTRRAEIDAMPPGPNRAYAEMAWLQEFGGATSNGRN